MTKKEAAGGVSRLDGDLFGSVQVACSACLRAGVCGGAWAVDPGAEGALDHLRLHDRCDGVGTCRQAVGHERLPMGARGRCRRPLLWAYDL
jgi:hypothetical protein